MKYSGSIRILANTEKLLSWLKQHNLSEKDLAEKLGYDVAYLKSVLHQKEEISVEFMKKLSNLTKLDLKDITITERKHFFLGDQIKRLRVEKGLSQEELGKAIDVSKQAISSYETGVRDPNPEQRHKLVEIFGITEAELFGGMPPDKNLDPEILEALQDPVAVKALLVTFKNSQDIKNTIKSLLDCLPSLSPEKRQAILALCK
ncbi:MAG: helix-turn-helix transcriptional regulator [Candidatus Omnitrophota bacterium]|jgi:transcriptional regulator with XRE-family HTH domain